MQHRMPNTIATQRRWNRSRGFTLVEIMIVISIGTILLSLVVGVAFAGMRMAKINRTKATLAVLQAVLDDYKRTTDVYPVVPIDTYDPTTPYFQAPVVTKGTAKFLCVVYYADTTTSPLSAITSDSHKAAGKFAIGSAQGMLQGLGTNDSVFDRQAAIIKDGWGNPILVTTAGTSTTHAVFASAGPDGNPNTDEDNIYSVGGAQ